MRLTRPGALTTISGSRWNTRLKCSRTAASFALLKTHLNGAQLRGLVVGQGISGEYAGARLTAREELQPVRHPVRWIELHVGVSLGVRRAVSRRLMEHHDVGKRLLPEPVVLQQHGLERPCEVGALLACEFGKRPCVPSWGDPHLVRITRADGHEGHGVFTRVQKPLGPVAFLGAEVIVEQSTA